MYFFVLGHNPTLSMAEILSRINTNLATNIRELSEEVLILETSEEIDAENLQRQLGGTIKIGQILTQINADLTQTKADLFLKELLRGSDPLEGQTLKKVFFGFSIYKLDPGTDNKKIELPIKKLAMRIKTTLKESGLSSRWVSSRERALSSVIVQKNNLIKQGAEFCFIVGKNKIYLGRTLSCQEFEEYEFYDFSRPARAIEEGMLPPKLAKIMINLTQAPKKATILDPFCGSGTILQEAARLGYNNLIGSDISEEAVVNARRNMEWLVKNSESKIRNPKQILNTKYQIFQTDVREISKKIPANSVDAIVTEPYLGPIKIGNWELEIGNLSNLYLAAFREFKQILKPDGKVVIIFPVFQTGKKQFFLPILDDLKKEWQVISLVSEDLKKHPVIKLTERNSIVYSRPGQKILREIFIFQRI